MTVENIRVVDILDPVAEPPKKVSRLAPFLDDVRGKAVGFRIQWSNFEVFCQRLEELLREKYQPSHVARLDMKVESAIRSRTEGKAVTPQQMDAFAKDSDWAVVGLAA